MVRGKNESEEAFINRQILLERASIKRLKIERQKFSDAITESEKQLMNLYDKLEKL